MLGMLGRSSLACLVLVAACAAPSGEEDATSLASTDAIEVGGLVEVQGFGPNPGALKMFEHIPTALPARAPLVVVLHGCMTNALHIAGTGFSDLADRHGFAVVYPQQSYLNNGAYCFNWANPMGFGNDDAKRGGGENESIREMVASALDRHRLDRERVYVVGFSAGAAMAIDLAAAWPDVFAGAASFAGVPYDCARSLPESGTCMIPGIERSREEWGKRARGGFPGYSGRRPRVSIWQGSLDNVVYPQNQIELAKQWTEVHGVSAEPTVVDRVDGQSHAAWKNAAGETVVETYRVEGMWHGMPVEPSSGCGVVGPYAFDHGICGARRSLQYFGIVP